MADGRPQGQIHDNGSAASLAPFNGWLRFHNDHKSWQPVPRLWPVSDRATDRVATRFIKRLPGRLRRTPCRLNGSPLRTGRHAPASGRVSAAGAHRHDSPQSDALGRPDRVGRADKLNEKELLPDFLTDFFVGLLGYTHPAAADRYTLSRDTWRSMGSTSTPYWESSTGISDTSSR